MNNPFKNKLAISPTRHCLLALCLLLLSDGVFAKSFFWEVRSGSNTIYLLGSIHLAREDIYPLPAVMDEAFDKSKYLVMEMDMDAVNMQKMGRLLRDKGLYPGAETVYDHIDRKTGGMLKKHLRERKIPEISITKYKPAFIAMTLGAMEMVRLGLKPDFGIEFYFRKKALKGKKAILELEGVEKQMNMLLNLPDASQFLRYTLLNMKETEKQLNPMLNAWKNGDSAAMQKLLNEPVSKYPKLKPLMKQMIDDRNVTMVEKIKSYLSSGEIHFVIAGAGHMVGDKGIVKLLSRENYRIRQF